MISIYGYIAPVMACVMVRRVVRTASEGPALPVVVRSVIGSTPKGMDLDRVAAAARARAVLDGPSHARQGYPPLQGFQLGASVIALPIRSHGVSPLRFVVVLSPWEEPRSLRATANQDRSSRIVTKSGNGWRL